MDFTPGGTITLEVESMPFFWESSNGGLNTEEQNLRVSLEQARQEWLAARVYFDSVTDPELVDHAIFVIQATEKKYEFMLRQARLMGLKEAHVIGNTYQMLG